MLIEDLPFLLVEILGKLLSLRSLACKSPPCPCDPETIFCFNMFQPPRMLLQWVFGKIIGDIEFCLRVFDCIF